MLDHQHGVARVHEALEHGEQLAHVLEVQAGRGLVEYVEGLARLAFLQLAGQLYPLRLAARQRRGRLPELDITQPHVHEGLELAVHAGQVLEEGRPLGHRHVQHVGDGLAAVLHLEGLAVVARAVADLAGHVDVGQEVHFNLYLPVAFAGFAAPARDVEGEAPRSEPARAAVGQAREELAYVVPHAGVGGGVGTRRAADRGLVDVDDLVHGLQPRDFGEGADALLGVHDAVGHGRRERRRDKRAFPRAGHARDHRQGANLYLGVHPLQVVFGRARYFYLAALGAAACLGHGHAARSRQILPGDGLLAGSDVVGCAGRDDAPAVHPGARPYVGHEVGAAYGVLVVFDHDDGIAQVAQAAQRRNQALVVALVQADRGLVEYVEHAHQPGAYLRGQAYALSLAAGQRGRGAVQGQVVQPDVDHELEARDDFLHDGRAHKPLALVEVEAGEELERTGGGQLRGLVDVLAAHRHGQYVGLQAAAVAGAAGGDGHVAFQALARALARGLARLVHDGAAYALPAYVPIGVAPVAGDVVHAHLLVAQPVEQAVAHLLRELFPGRVHAAPEMAADGGEDLRVVVARRAEAGHRAFGQRQRRVGHDQLRVHLLARAQAQAVRAGAVGGVEGEVARRELVDGVVVDGAGKCQRERVLAFDAGCRQGAARMLPGRRAVVAFTL